MPEDIRKRWSELSSKTNKELHKQQLKNALVNGVVPKDAESKTGFLVPAKMNNSMAKLLRTDDEQFDESWEEGQTITS